MSFIVPQLGSSYIPLTVRQEALDRVFADPGIPDAIHSTKSFWMKEPHPDVASVQSEHLPKFADYVIIGSGITGASVAQALLEDLETASPSEVQFPSRAKVIMLEARDSCSGATGRNGGHILETGEEYAMLKERLGKEEAIKIHKLRISHLQALIKSAENLGLTEETQVRKVRFLSVYFHQEAWEDIRKDIELFMAEMPDDSKGWGFIEADELAKVYISLQNFYFTTSQRLIHVNIFANLYKGVRNSKCCWCSNRHCGRHVALQIRHWTSRSSAKTIHDRLPPRDKHQSI